MTVTRLLGGLAAALLSVGFPIVSSAAPTHHPRHAAARAALKAHHGAPKSVKTPPAPSDGPAAGDTLLYDGRAAGAAGLTLAAWGGGSVEDSTEQAFAKSHSLKITTIDPYQGAKITFNTPVELGDTSDKTRYLAFILRLTASAPPATQAGFDPGAFAPGFDGQDQPGYGLGGYPEVVTTPIHNVHLLLTLANGATTDLLRPLPETGDPQSSVDQWISVAVPLSALRFPSGSAASPLQSVTLAGDDYAVLYVGQIKLTHDTTPITCFAGDEQSGVAGQPIVLQGSASGGLSTLHYAWDFDANTPPTEQASGPAVQAQYPKPGDYKATLTVSDLDGIKKPATSTTVVHVQ